MKIRWLIFGCLFPTIAVADNNSAPVPNINDPLGGASYTAETCVTNAAISYVSTNESADIIVDAAMGKCGDQLSRRKQIFEQQYPNYTLQAKTSSEQQYEINVRREALSKLLDLKVALKKRD